MAYTDNYGDSGGGSSAVLESSPDSDLSSSDSSTSVGTTSDAEGGDSGSAAPSDVAIPKSRFDEVSQKYQKLKWAERYSDPEQVQQRYELADWIDRDPLGFQAYYTAQLQQRGLFPAQQSQPQSQPQPQGTPQELPGPDYQYVDPQTGQAHQFYSANRVREIAAVLENKLTQRLAPMESFLGQQQTQMRAQQDAQRILSDAETNWPHFQDFKQDIWTAMQADRRLSLEGAYRKVVVPQIRERERQILLAELQQKPTATTTSPSATQAQGSEDLTKLPIATLFAREMRKRGLGR